MQKITSSTVMLKAQTFYLISVLDSNRMASIVSPIAQSSRPKSVSRPKRWSEEVEEGTCTCVMTLLETS